MEAFFAAQVMGVAFLSPANGSLHGFARGLVGGGIGEAFVEDHHDVAAEGELDVDGAFGSEHVRVAIEMRAEEDAFFGDFAEGIEAEDLETAGIGKNGAGPGHELVESAHAFNAFVAGAEEKMVGVGEDDFGIEVIDEIAGRKTFDGALSANGHEDRGFDDAVGSAE